MARWLLSSSPPIFDAFYFDCRWGLMSPSSAFVQTHSYKKLSFFFCSRWFWSLPLRFFLFILLRLIFDGRKTIVFISFFRILPLDEFFMLIKMVSCKAKLYKIFNFPLYFWKKICADFAIFKMILVCRKPIKRYNLQKAYKEKFRSIFLRMYSR